MLTPSRRGSRALPGTLRKTSSCWNSSTLQAFRTDAQILDYVPLLAAKRVRETLRAASKANH
ncbi:DUF3562 domain-containing protein [Paraburkholderia sp. A2WS-5]|uniref:DUF3562 domain-containing protein n=1 Tax=Paraburkholderia sp. A3RO-2L TaxID=3028376 RepID=UPI003B7D622F